MTQLILVKTLCSYLRYRDEGTNMKWMIYYKDKNNPPEEREYDFVNVVFEWDNNKLNAKFSSGKRSDKNINKLILHYYGEDKCMYGIKYYTFFKSIDHIHEEIRKVI